MYLQCTKKMLDKMDIQRIEMLPAGDCDDGADGFYSWHINYITINRRKAIVCMNNLTRYPIVLYRPKGYRTTGRTDKRRDPGSISGGRNSRERYGGLSAKLRQCDILQNSGEKSCGKFKQDVRDSGVLYGSPG